MKTIKQYKTRGGKSILELKEIDAVNAGYLVGEYQNGRVYYWSGFQELADAEKELSRRIEYAKLDGINYKQI